MGKNADDVAFNASPAVKKRNAKLLGQEEPASPQNGSEATPGGVRHKFGAVRTEVDGFKFASKAEAARYGVLKMLEDEGDVLFFLMQVPFHFPDGTKYVCDFQVFYADGYVAFEDVKGVETPVFKMKMRMMKHWYPMVKIHIIK